MSICPKSIAKTSGDGRHHPCLNVPTPCPPASPSNHHPHQCFTSGRLNYMGKKCTSAEKKARVEELADMVVKGFSQRELMRHVQESWGLSSQRSQAYIREARDVVKTDLVDIDRADMLASKVQMLEQIARDSVASGRENNAIGAIRLLAELTGFGIEQKR